MWLIDLNPFGEVTDALLFSWEELTSGDLTQQQVGRRACSPPFERGRALHQLLRCGVCVQEGPAFRYASSEVTVQPSPCLSYRIPRDFVDLSAGEDAYKLIDFLKLVILLYGNVQVPPYLPPCYARHTSPQSVETHLEKQDFYIRQ